MNKRALCRFRAWLEAYDNDKSTEKNIVTKKQMFHSVESADGTTLLDRNIGCPIPFNQIFYYQNAVVMQCSGLKDSNVKLIYESDVVELKFDTFSIKAVIRCGFYTDVNNSCFKAFGWYMQELQGLKECWNIGRIFTANKIVILGNIYETEEFKYLQTINYTEKANNE